MWSELIVCFRFHFLPLACLLKVYKSIFTSPSSAEMWWIRMWKWSSPEGRQAFPIPKKGNKTQCRIKTSYKRQSHPTVYCLCYSPGIWLDAIGWNTYSCLSTPASLQFTDCWAVVWNLWRIKLLQPLQLRCWLLWRCARVPCKETHTEFT
jgi:hypothetical protein